VVVTRGSPIKLLCIRHGDRMHDQATATNQQQHSHGSTEKTGQKRLSSHHRTSLQFDFLRTLAVLSKNSLDNSAND
jgi:hypothetical protein